MTDRTKYILLSILGYGLSVVPPLARTLIQFPVWIARSPAATVSGIAVILIFLSCLPFWKTIVKYLKSPSAPMVWIIICTFMYVMKAIATEMFYVSLVGAVSNIAGAGFFSLRKRYRRNEG